MTTGVILCWPYSKVRLTHLILQTRFMLLAIKYARIKNFRYSAAVALLKALNIYLDLFKFILNAELIIFKIRRYSPYRGIPGSSLSRSCVECRVFYDIYHLFRCKCILLDIIILVENLNSHVSLL